MSTSVVGSYPTSLLPLFMNTPLRIAAEDKAFSLVERGLDGLCDTYKGKAKVSEAKKVNANASGTFDEDFFGFGRFMYASRRTCVCTICARVYDVNSSK